MKSKIILSFFFALFISVASIAQSPANMTTANVDMHFSIPSRAITSEQIVIDASMIRFKSSEVATNYFNAICDNLLTYHYDGGKYAYLTLNHYDGMPKKSVEEWNLYIANLFPRYAALLAEMNK